MYFFAYPGKPDQISEPIETAAKFLNNTAFQVTTWKMLDIAGAFIRNEIIAKINQEEVFVADITRLNFNVTYEVAYAIGKGKPLLLVKNSSIKEAAPFIREVGIFDTIGWKEYTNSEELVKIIQAYIPKPLPISPIINTKVPVFFLDTKHKSDFITRITARIKKARLNFRSFDPNEQPRLSAYDAINHIAQSYGAVIPLLSETNEDYEVHNLRAAFLAGLADGMEKSLCLLQYAESPVPIDYRDFVKIYRVPEDINKYIADFAISMVEAFQDQEEIEEKPDISYLQKFDLGASSAENEMRTLKAYYLPTDEYRNVARGEVQLVVGRKGSGKSAIFLQIRDKERGRGANIVLDLKPDGYQLIKFKELVLQYLQEGTFQHTIMAFWEYILLLELTNKILVTDEKRYLTQSGLFEPYRELEQIYIQEAYTSEGDFTERMSILINNLTTSYKAKYGNSTNVRLSVPEITDLLYKNDIKELRNKVISYLKQKDKVWILFDNIDKGWPSTGLKHEDLIIIRTLIDATRQLQRQVDKERIDLFPVIFLRNDVYELLVAETSDRQKETKVRLDWVDPDLLRELIRLRIISSFGDDNEKFEKLWRNVCVSHYKGEETSQYLIERSLMRPRFLINLINACKSFAINLNHTKIEEDDIEKGFYSFSTDLLTDISYEIRDILPEAEDILYNFINCKVDMSKGELEEIINESISNSLLLEKIIDLLLWYGFIGIKINSHDIKYIYNMNYNMRLLKGLLKKNVNTTGYSINPAFWPALMIN
ncbi:P-loop ATPase, Sll1717 family [Rufibacter quisquiliarum]|uniref:Uncharacterized protein n=1 Tax=Rufibacter quisquiliarum TaxID=1549639 RepID=A0A839GU25_9BACT|nr:hypothetical protein [Rufibacter quisquiliarum]MBA9077291.1 hypothetical protein [Rufibacter quisquiliarum]